jgi:phenylacetate-CoA ligase
MTCEPAPIDSEILAFFDRAVASVPAYRAFLAAHGVDPGGVRTLADYARLPLVTKDNYVRVYSLAERCRGGRLDAVETLALSSGSTGEATIWPRDLRDEIEVTRRFEHVFRDGFRAAERRTLAVVAFPLGTWVGGMYTAACCRLLAAKGYPLTVVTPGNNVPEILRIVSMLGPAFEQVVLLGYPPFMKGVIDEGLARGLDWAALRPKLVLAGEVFTEEWRSWVAEQAGIADPIGDIAALYGTTSPIAAASSPMTR